MKFLLALAFVIGLTCCQAQNSITEFKYNPDKLPLHQLQLYIKSNLDGSRASFVAIYMKEYDTIESFKWTEGNNEGTLVKAQMDWQRFTVSHFAGGRIRANGELNTMAQLSIPSGSTRAQVQITGMDPSSVELEQFPWHSYDFDFASLGMVMTQLVSTEPTVEFMISDIAREAAGPVFKEIGIVSMRREEMEEKFGNSCQRYHIDGPGLDDRGGKIWFDQQGRLVGFEIQKPDEPGFVNNKLRRVEVKELSVEEWEAFKKQKLQN